MSLKSSRSSGGLQPSELVESAILRYKAQRRLSPSRRRCTKVSLGQLALSEMLLGEASDHEAPLFSLPPVSEPQSSEAQYARFKAWISESPESLKPELAQLLYPMFTHLYLDLVSSGIHPTSSGKFLRRHQSTFLGNAEFNAFIRLLSAINSPQQLALQESVNTFRSSKYTVTLSPQTYTYLLQYVHQGKSPLLLRLLQSKIDLKLADPLAACSRPEALQRLRYEMAHEESNNVGSSCAAEGAHPAKGSTTSSGGGGDILKLREVISSVRSGPTPLPSTILYRIQNVPSPLAISEISSDSSLMALGSENSSIYLYDLLPNVKKAPVQDDHARVQLSCDFIPSDDDEGSSKKRRGAPDILLAHSGPVYDLKFLQEKDFLLSVSEDTTMRLWETSTCSNKVVYSGHSYPIWCLDVDRLGYNIVTGSMDRTAKLWNTEYAFPIRIYAGHEKDVDCVAFHPNCNYFATGSIDKSIRLWSHADAKMVRVLTGHKSGVYALAFSPDGKYLASGGEDQRIRIWDLASSRQLKELRGHTDTIYSLIWNADSSLLSSGGLDGIVRIWDMTKTSSSSPLSNAASPSSSEEVPSSSSSKGPFNVPQELVGTYKTQCSNILDLRYSHHNTLLVTAVHEEPKN